MSLKLLARGARLLMLDCFDGCAGVDLSPAADEVSLLQVRDSENSRFFADFYQVLEKVLMKNKQSSVAQNLNQF